MKRARGHLLLIALLGGCALGDNTDLMESPRPHVASTPPGPSADDTEIFADSVDTRQTPDAGPPDGDSDVGRPHPTEEPRCEDRLGTDAIAVGPQGLMIQVPSIKDTCELERALDHVCQAHPEIQDLILTSVDTWTSGRVTTDLKVDVLEVIEPYLDCFPNVFVGTVSEILLPDPYGAWTIEDADARWTWLRAAREVAPKIAAWMDQRMDTWHWYVSYEANLNAFVEPTYRNAYVAMLQQHIDDLSDLNDGVVAWSPTFWTPPGELTAPGRADLAVALSDTFARLPVDWVLVQDHLGVQPSWRCEDALAYHAMVKAAAPQLASVQLNIEYFTTDGGIGDGDPAELRSRVACYKAGGASIGASFEVRYWYDTHGH